MNHIGARIMLRSSGQLAGLHIMGVAYYASHFGDIVSRSALPIALARQVDVLARAYCPPLGQHVGWLQVAVDDRFMRAC